MTAEEILARLSEQKTSVSNLQAPNRPGVYAIFHKDINQLLKNSSNDSGLVYIGQSGNLAQREFETHFNAGETGFSTLRRTIGALLKDEFSLKAIPRGSGDSKTNYTNYKFTSTGEDIITKWMKENLLVAIYETNDVETLEPELISLACPIFNLTGCDNPYAKDIKAKRKVCAEEARK